MANFTYFIISPGYDVGSLVRYPDLREGNYIKFGDASADHVTTAGVRAAYLTHNPDIGVAAVMGSQAFAAPALGTRLKQFIVGLGIAPVGTSEWFSIQTRAAWSLTQAMIDWDRVTVNQQNLPQLQNTIRQHLA